MTEKELIAKQQLEIENLKETLRSAYESFSLINGILYNIGAPLNDNCLEYSREQLGPFFRISELLMSPDDEKEYND